MAAKIDQQDGFPAGDRELPTPPIEVSPDTRERLIQSLTEIVAGSTPEELAGYLDDGFPDSTGEALERPGERDEMGAHVDLLLTVLQTPAPATA
jgi:hypothetical protein